MDTTGKLLVFHRAVGALLERLRCVVAVHCGWWVSKIKVRYVDQRETLGAWKWDGGSDYLSTNLNTLLGDVMESAWRQWRHDEVPGSHVFTSTSSTTDAAILANKEIVTHSIYLESAVVLISETALCWSTKYRSQHEVYPCFTYLASGRRVKTRRSKTLTPLYLHCCTCVKNV